MTAQDHGQDGRQDGIQLAISPPGGYTRGRGHVGADLALVEQARSGGGAGQDGDRPADAVAGPTRAGGPRRRGPWTAAEAEPPLARRAREIRADATSARRRAHTPRAELAAELDYVRATDAAADKRGMSDPRFTTAVRDAITALRAAGDTGTAAMLTWRPGS